jgi:tetratricopeptide (TPR) repeat protein
MKKIILLLVITYGLNAQTLEELYNTGQYTKAIEVFKTIEEPSVDEQILLAKVYCAKGMNSRCIETYDKALTSTEPKDNLVAKFNYAKLLQTQKDYKSADSIYTELLKEIPDNAEFHYQRGKIGMSLDQEAYHQHFLTALSYDPSHIKSAQEASIYFIKVDNFDKAKEIAAKTLQKVPGTPRLIGILAQVSYRQEKWNESLNHILKLEQLKEALPVFVFKLKGNNYLKLNRQEDAIEAYKKAFAMDNKDPEICLKLGEIYLANDQPKKARRYLSIYNYLRDTSMWEYNYLMGQYFMQEKQHRMAFRYFELTLKENINHEAAQYYRAVAADNYMEDKSKALDYYTNYIQTWQVEDEAKYIELALRRAQDIRQELFMED